MSQKEGARQHEITVMGLRCKVWTVKKSKTVWLTYGEFGKKSLDATSYSSESDALSKWKAKAHNEAIQ